MKTSNVMVLVVAQFGGGHGANPQSQVGFDLTWGGGTMSPSELAYWKILKLPAWSLHNSGAQGSCVVALTHHIATIKKI